MTTTFSDGTQLEVEIDRLHTPDTVALANVYACRQQNTRLESQVGQLERVFGHPLTVLQREATCQEREVDKLKHFLKPLLTVLQRENTRLMKQVDKLEGKLWQARERADLDSQAVGDAHQKTEQAERLAAAAESCRKEVQGQLDELQPQLQVSLRSLHGALQQPSGQHRRAWMGWSHGCRPASLPCHSAVPTPAPVSSPPLRCAHSDSIVKASWGRLAARLASTGWHLRAPHCARAWHSGVCTSA